MTDQELEAIRARYRGVKGSLETTSLLIDRLIEKDVPALIDEVERLREQLGALQGGLYSDYTICPEDDSPKLNLNGPDGKWIMQTRTIEGIANALISELAKTGNREPDTGN